MALPDIHSTSPSPLRVTPMPPGGAFMPPGGALGRLPHLHDESRLALRRARLLARAVPAAGVLLAMGTAVSLFGGGGLAPSFLWSLLVFGGVVAVLASHLRLASIFQDLAGSAADMRAILLYLGLAWGTGAFLALAPAAPLLVVFAVAPTLALALMLGDVPAILAFAGPVTLLGLAGIVLRTGSITAAVLLLLAQAGIGLLLLRSRTGRAAAPPGLALR